MAETVQCPGCQTKLKLKPEYAGKKIKCPKCAHTIVVPSAPGVTTSPPRAATSKTKAGVAIPVAPDDEDDGAVSAEPPRKKGRKSENMTPCPECGEMVDDAAVKCPHCKAVLEADEEEEYKRWKKCPHCRKQMGRRVLWTFWGSFYFTALFKHVRCDECGTAYNGKTGRSNIVPALMCVFVALLLIGGIVGFIIWMLKDRGQL